MPVTPPLSGTSSSNVGNGPRPNCNATNGCAHRLLDGRSEAEFLATAQRVGPYLTLMRGISFEEENIRWAERALAIIEQRQGAGSAR